MNKLSKIVSCLLVISSIAYPLTWLFTKQEYLFILYIFPYILSILWGIKAYLHPIPWQRLSSLGMSILLIIIGITKSINNMYWYPVIINSLMLIIFATSLFTSQSLIERIARLQDPKLPEKGVIYTRKVTIVWCIFFLFNIIISTKFVLTHQYQFWALYTGIISYILMGILFIGEWCVRKMVMK